jgi:ferrous iron transport protein B
MDEARRKGMTVDTRSLARDLGVPAVASSARTGEGLGELVRTVAAVVGGQIRTAPLRPPAPPEVQAAVDELVPLIRSAAPSLPNPRWVAYRLLDGDHRVQQALLSGELDKLALRQAGPVERSSRKIALEGGQ